MVYFDTLKGTNTICTRYLHTVILTHSDSDATYVNYGIALLVAGGNTENICMLEIIVGL